VSAPPPNPDTRDLPYGWTQQYNWEYRQWFYVNTRENPPRSSWEHPLGPIPQNFGPPPGPPPPDRGYSRSPYDRPPPGPQGYGYQPSYGQPPQGYYNNAPAGGYAGGSAYAPGYPQNRGNYPGQQVVYVDEQRAQKKSGPGMGTALLAGGAGLVGGALLMDAFDDHEEREREIGYDQGFDQGYQDGFDDNGGW